MEFKAIIGLELHIQMKTNSKLFSTAPVKFGEPANTCVAPFDIDFPGVLPIPNKQTIINALRVAHALNMQIDNVVVFDRKNYFYSDLPKGYQITQELRPLGKNGQIMIDDKSIKVERLHIEEDTCKQLHYKDYSLLDYNRAGIPLIEIVTSPDIKDGEEARRFVEKIRSVVTYLDVSDGKMEEGSLRCDINISLKEKGSDSFGTKVEIKNLNSLSNIQKAINYEIRRQTTKLLNGEKIKQQTRRYDEKNKKTISMREKIDAVDYKFFVEPNIPPIRLSDEFITQALNSSPELADQKIQRYIELGLSQKNADLLTSEKATSMYFDELVNLGTNPKLACNWLLMDVQTILNKENIEIDDFSIRPKELSELIKMVESGQLSNKQAREIFTKMMKSGEEPHKLITQLNIQQMNNEAELLTIINELLDENQKLISDYKNGKDRAVGYLVGQVMKKTNGEANPALTSKLVIQEMRRR